MSRGYGVRICSGPDCRCPNVMGGPFAGMGAHRDTCRLGVEWARARLASGQRTSVDVGQDLRAVFGLALVFPPPPWRWTELPGWGTAVPARSGPRHRGPVQLLFSGVQGG